MLQYVSLAVGYVFSIIIAHFLIKCIVRSLWKSIDDPPQPGPELLSTVQGLIERFLYTTFWHLGFPVLIGVWLALKVASQWGKWSEKPGYNIFLAGSGLSVVFAAIGAKLIQWVADGRIRHGLIIAGVLIFITLVLRAAIAISVKRRAVAGDGQTRQSN